MVEGARLESVFRGNSNVGSNPTLSAIFSGMLQALTVYGPFRGPSGYDHHVREFVRELHRQGVQIELKNLPFWSPGKLPAQARDAWFDTLNKPCGSRTALHFCMPHQVKRVRGKSNVNFTMFEATRISQTWVAANRNHDLVIVPTESSRRAWVDSGMPAHRIQLCPLGIDPAAFDGKAGPLPLWSEEGAPVSSFRVRMLQVCEMGARKNLPGLLAAWTLATSRSDDAILILKLGAYPLGSLRLFRKQIAAMEQRIGKRLRDAAPVLLFQEILSDGQMPALYAAATHYISLSFGEGWDLTMMEAGATGLKLIAPDHSAYREYLDATVASLIPAREEPVRFDAERATAALFKGACWWRPDHDAAVAAIRRAIDGRDGDTSPARDRILRNYTWEG